MNLGDCTVTIGNQKVHVTDVEISYDFPGNCQEVSIQGRILDREEPDESESVSSQWKNEGSLTINCNPGDLGFFTTGYDKADSIAYGGRNWGKTLKAYDHFFSTGSKDETLNTNEGKNMATYTLTEQLANDNLDEDVRLLLNENVTELDGTLTEQGKELMLNILFNEPETRAKVIDTLKKMIEKRKSEK